jgi:hypothetical protein
MNQLRPVDRNSDGKQAGEITLVDVATGKPFPIARADSISWWRPIGTSRKKCQRIISTRMDS